MHTPREKLDYQVHTSLTEKERDKLNDLRNGSACHALSSFACVS